MIEHAVGAVVIAVLDRFLLKRRKLKIFSVERSQDDTDHVRFEVGFNVPSKLISGEIVYTIRDKQNPKTVIQGKERVLDFSEVGANTEYLLFNKKLFESYKRNRDLGRWILNVKLVTSGSRINPLYKIFPLSVETEREFNLDE